MSARMSGNKSVVAHAKARDNVGHARTGGIEKQVGERTQPTNFFMAMNRSYPDPDRQGEDITTTVLNPRDLLIAADLYRIAWEFILEECNRQ